MYELVVALLDDEHGISEDAWGKLLDVLPEGNVAIEHLIASVRATEGRYYLPSDWENNETT